MDTPPDKLLIQQTLDGQREAFDQLILRYQDRLVHSLEHALGSRDDALEAAQQAFVSGWRRLETFRGDASFYSWLYRIAINAAISRKRKRRLNASSLEAFRESSGISPVDHRPEADPEHQMRQHDNVRMVRTALQEIAEEFRQALVLKEIDGFSYEEIASILDIPIGTVRSRIFRARQELSEKLRRMM